MKQKKLTNIYAGRTLSLVLKKLDDGSSSLVNLIYPVSNTLNIEIRKSQNNFIVKENNRLVEKEAKKVVKGFGGWRESRKKIMFNLLDFLDMLGYTGVNEDETLFAFSKKSSRSVENLLK